MGLKQFEDGKYISLDIKWSIPIKLDISEIKKRAKNNDSLYFYKILGEFNGKYKLFYIGKCVYQYVWKRLFQKDHQEKQAKFKEDHPRHNLYISFGNIIDDDYTDTQIDNIERLLIYSHSNKDFSYLKNKLCTLSHKVIKNYSIRNNGWRKEGMYKKVAYGLFFEK